MLVQLTIFNLAIINHLEVSFRSGLNILSGETGAGKSIIINAVNLILGGRASADLIRSGSEEARVEALFALPVDTSIRHLFEELDLPFQKEVLIKRVISREGRNRITVNQSLCNLTSLSRIGQHLISISGQHEHQLLLRPENHLYLLDEFGDLTGSRLDLNVQFARSVALKNEIRDLEREIRDGESQQELARFQMEEIEKAEIKPEEDLFLEEERKRLRNRELLTEIVSETYQVLFERDHAVLSELGACVRRLEKGANLDKRIKSVQESLSGIKVELEEIVFSLREMQESPVEDPHRLDWVEERIHLLNKLKKKYGPTLEEVVTFGERVSKGVGDLDRKRGALAEKTRSLQEQERNIVALATHLSERRKKAAKGLEKAAVGELALLAMGGTRFQVKFNNEAGGSPEAYEDCLNNLKADGFDRIEFMLSTNVGEELKPLSKVASGGELSRIMLALKTILARKGSVETVIFDEVDSGIGGATAELVGEKLRSLAAYHQILCITHLPQIAGKGETHFLVRKVVAEKRTTTTISQLDEEERVTEIARLLGGKTVSESALAHAREILEKSHQ
jgi:DNA repair protein RecN (Recombination protein N)